MGAKSRGKKISECWKLVVGTKTFTYGSKIAKQKRIQDRSESVRMNQEEKWHVGTL